MPTTETVPGEAMPHRPATGSATRARASARRHGRLSARCRALTAAAALVLLGACPLPLWRIRLAAPQYPEGLGMVITLHSVVGAKNHDLENINELNHYIGMRQINPAAIPVLRAMPWVVGALVVSGLLVALSARRHALEAWMAGFTMAALAGLAEFWWWEYDFGHNLDTANAIIKIPGMNYQPPLLGSRQLLNFTATSTPSSGTWLVGIAFILGLIAVIDAYRSRTAASQRPLRASIAVLAGLVLLSPRPAAARPILVVGPGPHAAFHRLQDAIRMARAGDTIEVLAGTYREPTILVDRPVRIIGRGLPTFDGESSRQLMTVTADSVTIRGLRFAHVGTSFTEDRAAIKVINARGCAILDNVIDDAFFGLYLARASGCRLAHNMIRGAARTETSAGNGIHLWATDSITVDSNTILGHRDGIYLEFSRHAVVRGNRSLRNLRYGLHFMYSDDCQYLDNTFGSNGAGVAVMYTHRVTMLGNRFENSLGSAAYGLLLKEIVDSRVANNTFRHNSTGLQIDGANRLAAEHNDFVDNGWGLRLDGSTQNARFSDNNFVANTFDVGSTGRELSTTINGNYWDRYAGYDLDHDGTGDVPFPPVRMFSAVVARNPAALILLHSGVAALLDAAERVVPALTPRGFADSTPRMAPVR